MKKIDVMHRFFIKEDKKFTEILQLDCKDLCNIHGTEDIITKGMYEIDLTFMARECYEDRSYYHPTNTPYSDIIYKSRQWHIMMNIYINNGKKIFKSISYADFKNIFSEEDILPYSDLIKKLHDEGLRFFKEIEGVK